MAEVVEKKIKSLYARLNQLQELSQVGPETAQLLDRLFDHIDDETVIAVENARRVFELATLNKIGQTLSSAAALTVEEILELVYDQTSLLMDTDNFYIALYDGDRDTVTFAFIVDKGKRQEATGDWASRKAGRGLTEYIIRHREPVFVPNDVDNWLYQHRDEVDRIGQPAKSWLGVPMITGDQVIGVIGVQNYEAEYVYDKYDLSVLSTIASQAAIAVANARLLESTRRKVEELRLLREVGQAITSTIEPHEVLQRVVQEARTVVGADIAALFPLVDGRFQPPVVDGAFTSHELDPIPKRGGIASQVLEKGFVIVENLEQQPEMTSRFAEIEGVRSFAGVALRVGGQVADGELVGGEPVGVLYVDFRDVHPLTEDECNTVKVFATQAAIAISNARLFEASEQRTKEVQRLAEVGQRILTSPRDSSRVLQDIVDQAVVALGADLVILYLYHQARQEVELPAIRAGTFLEPEFPEHTAVDENDIAFKIVSREVPYYAPDAATDELLSGVPSTRRPPGTQPFVVRERIASSAGIPLKVADEIVGVMFVNYRTPKAFSNHRRKMIETFANYAAIAIQNARLFDQVRAALDRRIEELDTLVEIDKSIMTLDLDAVLGKIVEAASTIAGVPNCNIMLVDESGEYLELRAVRGALWLERAGKKFKIGEQGVTGWVAEHKRTARIPDVRADEWRDIYIEALSDTRSELAVPLLDENGELLGVINLTSPQVGTFSLYDQRLLEGLAKQAVIAIQNQRRYEAEQRARRQLAMLRDIDRAISSTLDWQEALSLILDRGLDLVGAPYGNIMLYDKVRHDLWLAAGRGTMPGKERARQKIGEGIVGLVARDRRSLRVSDVTEEPWQAIYRQFIEGIRSELAVPMVYDGVLVGVFNAESLAVGDFSEDDRRLLEALAAQAVIVIQNAEQYQRLEAFQEIDRAIISTFDPNEVLHLILDNALRLTGAEIGEIRLVDPDTKEMVVRVSRTPEGVAVDEKWRRIPAGQGTPGWCVDHRQPVIVEDTRQDARYVPYFQGMRSEVTVPLMRGGEAVGVVNLESPQVGAFGEHDLRLLETLAGHAVIALQNAANFEEMRKARERFEILSEVGKRLINAPLDVEAILDIGLEEGLARLEKAHAVGAWLWDEGTGTLRLRAARGVEEDGRVWEPIKPGEGINGWVAVHRRTCSVPDIRHPPAGVTYYPRLDHTRGELVVPLVVGNAYFGNLDLAFSEVNVFDEDDVRLIEGIADQLAVALHRLRTTWARQEVEQRLQAAEVMGTIGQSAFELAHRLGNELGLVRSYVNIIRSAFETQPVAAQVVDENLAKIVQDVGRVLELSSGLKEELAEFQEAEKPAQEKVIVPARVLLEEAAQSIPSLPTDIQVHFEAGDDVAPVRVVHRQGAVILRNLFVNAVEAMPEGGTITLRARNAGRYVEFQVADTGIGIPPERQSRIFDLFYSTKGSFGFGLWSARRNALANGGELKVVSEPGRGAIFTLTLPRANLETPHDN
jgi:GAF domain-containing protein